MKKVSFCKKNSFKTKKIVNKLKKEFPEFTIKRKGCMSKCKTCKMAPFSMLDGKVVTCETSKELYDHLHKKLSKKKK